MISVIYDNDIALDPIVTGVTWSGDITQPYRTLSVNLCNTLDGKTREVSIVHGKELRLESDGAELFRGVIFTHSIDSTGSMSVTAYDEAVYLTKSMDTRKFTNMTATAIIRQLCAEFGIPTGSIAETGYVVPKLILNDKTLWDMMTIALTETRKQTGRRFFITSSGGNLTVIERGEKVVTAFIESGSNLLDASYSQSIEDMRNQVKVTGGDPDKNPLVATAKDDALIAAFGVMQRLENADSSKTQSEIQQLAQTLLAELGKVNDEASVTALGDVNITAGTAIYVSEPITSIVGAFYVLTDTHSFEGGNHKMTLRISGDEGLPKLEYDDPEPDAAQKKKKNGGMDVVDRIFNARGVGDQ